MGFVCCLGDLRPAMKIEFFRHSLLSRGGDKMIIAHAGYLAEQGHEVTILASVVNTVFAIQGIEALLKIVVCSLYGIIQMSHSIRLEP